MLTLTADLSVFVDALVQKLEDHAELELQDVFYGDQNAIPTTPIACVEPDSKDSPLKGVQRITNITFTAHILVYHSAVTSPQSNRRGSDQLARKIEQVINGDPQLTNGDTGELVIHCWVSSIQSGYSTKQNSVMRSSRLTVTGTSQEILPTPQ